MSTVHLSDRSLLLLSALNRRDIRGPAAMLILRKYSQQRIARQIDYYDHEVVFTAHLPEWAASRWLAWRIRHDAPPPKGYLRSSQSLEERVREIRYRQPTA